MYFHRIGSLGRFSLLVATFVCQCCLCHEIQFFHRSSSVAQSLWEWFFKRIKPFSTVFNHFQPFSTMFNHFKPFLTVFNNLTLFSTAITRFHCFHPCFIIFNRFQPFYSSATIRTCQELQCFQDPCKVRFVQCTAEGGG